MSTNTNTQEGHEDGTRSPAMDLLIARSVGNAKSMSFTIPVITGSLESELHTLREQFQYLHAYHITARALMPIIKVGHGPDAVVQNSGLVLWIAIGNMPPEVLACVRIKCQRAMRQIARDKGLCRDYGSEQYILSNTTGFLGRGHVASQVQTFTKNIREYFRTGKNPTNGVIQYRISKSGAFESAEVDFRQEPTRIKFTEATVPEPGVDSIPGQLVV